VPDNRVYDAINIYKFSPTGQGQSTVGGDSAYQQRYRSLAQRVQQKLWELWGDDEIGWHDTGKSYGTAARRIGHNIKITHEFEPTLTGNYYTADNQAFLAASTAIMVHECVHLVEERTYVEEEVVCRTLQILIYLDLVNGVPYTSKVCGQRCTAKIAPIGRELAAFMAEYNQNRVPAYRNGQIADLVVGNKTYRDSLEADFVIRSLGWWGGIARRQPTTRGYYLNTLAGQGRNARFDLIMQILESFQNPAQWNQAQPVVKMDQLRQALQLPMYSTPNHQRVVAVQRRLGVNLGAR
jgi:hypothetical protein